MSHYTTTQAIVLRSLRYGDNSLIIRCFTRQSGVLNFIAGTSRRARSGLRPSLFQALQQIEVQHSERSRGELLRIREAHPLVNYTTIPYHPVKSCLALFLAEVLQHLLREEEGNEALFRYVKGSLDYLDKTAHSVANFHLLFLMGLPHFLGFAPERLGSDRVYFDLAEGRYSAVAVDHPHFLEGALLEKWRQLQELSVEAGADLRLSAAQRSSLLQALLDYFRLHVHAFGELKSLAVLRAVLRD